MGKFIDRTGMRYGQLRVIADAGVGPSKKRLWKCVCDCGKEVTVQAGCLATGNTRSCGCFHLKQITKHGGYKRASYNTWRAMLRRCNNPLDKDYPRYGARGITVCSEWEDYTVFARDMGEPGEGQTLDRIDNSKGYLKKNCRWASAHTQAVNSRRPTKTGYRGVIYLTKYKKWIASLTVHKKRYYSAVFDSIEDAVVARQQLEQQHWAVQV